MQSFYLLQTPQKRRRVLETLNNNALSLVALIQSFFVKAQMVASTFVQKYKTILSLKAQEALNNAQSTLSFEQNIGQFPKTKVQYYSFDAQNTYFFAKNEIRSVVRSSKDSLHTAYALQCVGANEAVDTRALENHAQNVGLRIIPASQVFIQLYLFTKKVKCVAKGLHLTMVEESVLVYLGSPFNGYRSQSFGMMNSWVFGELKKCITSITKRLLEKNE